MSSAVAGVLSPNGAFRTVIIEVDAAGRSVGELMPNFLETYFAPHLVERERVFVVPGLWVEEPVPFNSHLMAYCVRMAHRTAVKALSPENPCGECRMCCKTLYIAPVPHLGVTFQKSSHSICHYCDHETGCLVNYHKPAPCREFRCLWLQSRDKNWIMPDELRPDRCGVIFTGPEEGDPDNLIYLHPNVHDREAHNREPVVRWMEGIEAEGTKIRFVTHYHGEKLE